MPRRSPEDQGSDEDGARGRDQGQQQAHDLAHLELQDPLKTCRHLFLQTLISRRVLTKELAEQLYDDCVKLCKVEDAPDLQDFLATIETGINLIGFELRQTKDQETGRTVYILTNSVQDPAAKLATEYKAEEIAYFKAIVKKIMQAEEMSYCISQAAAVKEAKTPITRVVAIQLVKSFLAKDWLSLHPSGRLILSPRSLTELAPYLRETFAEEDDEDVEPRERTVVYCAYCSKIVTSGYACPNRHCGIRLHTYCAVATIGSSGVCPDGLSNQNNPCTQVWRKDAQTQKPVGHPVGVAALGLDGDDDEVPAAPTSQLSDDEGAVTPHAKGKKRKSGGGASGANAKRKPVQKGKGKGKKKQQDSDEEEDELMDDDEEEEEEDFDEDDDDERGSSAARGSARRSSRRGASGKQRTIQPPSSESDE